MERPATFAAFAQHELVGSGTLATMLTQVKKWYDRTQDPMVLFFEERTGKQRDFDLRGSLNDVLRKASASVGSSDAASLLDSAAATHAGPGRPKLGVVCREISLLPRHWQWLEEQPNGASAALRRLIDRVKNSDAGTNTARQAIDATARFLSAIAGNFPNYEEATRALYAQDRERLHALMNDWPRDIKNYVLRVSL